MRGAFVDQGGLFSYIAPEARVPANHPLRKIRELVRDVLGELNRSLGRLRERRPPVDSAGAATERAAAPGVLRHLVGRPADGAVELQSDVPLVRGTFARRSGLGPDHLHQEPSTGCIGTHLVAPKCYRSAKSEAFYHLVEQASSLTCRICSKAKVGLGSMGNGISGAA